MWLQQVGYRTVLIGKYLNGYNGSPAGYVPPGWTTWHAFAEANGAYYDYRLRHTDGSETTHGDGAAAYSTDVLARIGVRTVREAPSYQPLFLMFTPYAVHGPTTPAPRHVGTATVGPFLGPSVNEADVSDKPPWVAQLPTESIDHLTQLRRNTQETLRSVDEAIAALLDAFRQHRDLDDTLVIFTSDNGSLWGEHRLRGKNMSYNVSSRVPLAMRWPGHLEPGSEDRRLALNVDVTATIAEAAGVPLSSEIEGVSLLGLAGARGLPARITGDRWPRRQWAEGREARLLRVSDAPLCLRPLFRWRGGAQRLPGRPVRAYERRAVTGLRRADDLDALTNRRGALAAASRLHRVTGISPSLQHV